MELLRSLADHILLHSNAVTQTECTQWPCTSIPDPGAEAYSGLVPAYQALGQRHTVALYQHTIRYETPGKTLSNNSDIEFIENNNNCLLHVL